MAPTNFLFFSQKVFWSFEWTWQLSGVQRNFFSFLKKGVFGPLNGQGSRLDLGSLNGCGKAVTLIFWKTSPVIFTTCAWGYDYSLLIPFSLLEVVQGLKTSKNWQKLMQQQLTWHFKILSPLLAEPSGGSWWNFWGVFSGYLDNLSEVERPRGRWVWR